MRAFYCLSALTSPPRAAAGPFLSRFAGEYNGRELHIQHLTGQHWNKSGDDKFEKVGYCNQKEDAVPQQQSNKP
jgi:hypothetical protein